MDDPISTARARIGGVLSQNKNALTNILGDRLNKLLDVIQKVIRRNLEKFGDIIADKARQNILNSSPSGRVYTYIDINTREELAVHEASYDLEPPSIFTSLLLDSIEYRIHTYDNSVEIGVYTDKKHEYQTFAFFGESDIVLAKRNNQGTPVNEYAKYLEEGTDKMSPRPFLHPAFMEGVKEARKQFRRDLVSEVQKVFRRKVPIYFRIYVKE
jgi:HK97 gp10 family phage protein